jgi:monovalent cation:H+ antiporter-2, CPA2 family
MPHDVTLIATVAIGFVLAFAFGFLANRLRLPPLVGYLVAGVVMRYFSKGVIADNQIAGQLSEIGVMLLMFGVGLHFSVGDLMAVRRIAIPGAIGQIIIATAIGTGMASLWGWSLGAGLVLGLSLSVASTVVLLKALEERNGITTPNGRIAIGWLIVEDLAMVLALVLLPAFAEMLGGSLGADPHANRDRSIWLNLALTFGKVGAFVATALIVGPRVMPWLLRQVARTGSRELFTLCILSSALGIAFGSAKLFGVSFALGAFFAGVILNESDLSHKAAANSLPLQDAFAVLFFIAAGLLFDPMIIVREPLMVCGVLLLIVLAKSLVAMAIVLILGYPMSTALTVSASLAQIGEFSFILAGIGVTYQLLPQAGFDMILAGSLLSITLNPLMFAGTDRLIAYIKSKPRLQAKFEDARATNFATLQADLEAARLLSQEKAAAHRTFTPEELAQRFSLFADLTAEQREVLVLHFHNVETQPGERIIRAGDEADVVYFIAAGEVEVSVAGKRIKLGPGDYFGEMALITGKPRSADVTTLDYCKFATLSLRDFRKFLRKYPHIRERVAALAAERGEMNRQFIEELSSQSSESETPAATP